jgi:enediyne polyketide synthase
MELVAGRPGELWSTMLGEERQALARLLASQSGEDIDVEATRVWAAMECLKKAGLPLREPLKLVRRNADGWTLLHGASTPVATFVTRVDTLDRPVAIAVLASDGVWAGTAEAVADGPETANTQFPVRHGPDLR